MGIPRLTVVSRADWGGGVCTVGYAVPHSQFIGEVIHHDVIPFDGNAADVISETKKHAKALKRSRPDLGGDWPYSWGLAPDYSDDDHTIIVEGRGWRRTGAHTSGYNSTRYGVVLFGNYVAGQMRVTRGQTRGARYLGAWFAQPLVAQPTLYHRQIKSTACPGEGGIALSLFAQPPFLPSDVTVFSPEVPAVPDTSHMFNPPLVFPPGVGMVDSVNDPFGGAWVLLSDGGIITTGTARFFGGVNGKPYFFDHGGVPTKLVPFIDANGRDRYLIRDQHGHDYGHDGF